jgi:hypothetical protein
LYPFRVEFLRDVHHHTAASPNAMPEALREKLEPAIGYTRQATCNPIVKEEHPTSVRLPQSYDRGELRASRRSAHVSARTHVSDRRYLPIGAAMIRSPRRSPTHRPRNCSFRNNHDACSPEGCYPVAA